MDVPVYPGKSTEARLIKGHLHLKFRITRYKSYTYKKTFFSVS